MGVAGLPSWLPDWEGAEAVARDCDISRLRSLAQELVDLVFTDDTVYLDALPSVIESAMVVPLGILSDALDDGTDVELLVASRLVQRSVGDFLAEGPEDLRRSIGAFPSPVGQ